MDYLDIETDEGTVLINMDDPQLTELLDIYDPIVKERTLEVYVWNSRL